MPRKLLLLQVSVKEEEGSTAEVLQETPRAEDSAMPEAASSAPALPDGAAHLPKALDASCAAAAAGDTPAAAPAVKPEASEKQKPEVQLLEYTPAVKVRCCLACPPHYCLPLASHAGQPCSQSEIFWACHGVIGVWLRHACFADL